jgi:hypothetical protein
LILGSKTHADLVIAAADILPFGLAFNGRSKLHQQGCRLSPPDHPGDHRQALAA